MRSDEYLRRLIELEEKAHTMWSERLHNQQKPIEPASVGFVGTPPSESEISRTWWPIYRDGRRVCTLMVPEGLTRAEALGIARDRWPESTIDIPEGDAR